MNHPPFPPPQSYIGKQCRPEIILRCLIRVTTVCKYSSHFYTPPLSCHTIVAGYYGFTLDIRQSVCPSGNRTSVCISFPDDNLSKHPWIFTKLGMCIDIVDIWFGIANGQIPSNFVSFPDDNLSKYQEILTKLGTCIDIKEIWFGIAKGQILSMFDRVICLQHDNGGVL